MLAGIVKSAVFVLAVSATAIYVFLSRKLVYLNRPPCKESGARQPFDPEYRMRSQWATHERSFPIQRLES